MVGTPAFIVAGGSAIAGLVTALYLACWVMALAMSTAALEHIAHFSPDTFADGLLLAAGVSNLP